MKQKFPFALVALWCALLAACGGGGGGGGNAAAPPTTASISAQPADQSVIVGRTATFSVAATGAAL